jgi:hypothetical protein
MARADKEANKAYNREYMRKKREAAKAAGIALASDEWRKNNPDKSAEIDRRYAERHPDRVKAKGERQRARRKELGIKQVRTEEQKAANRAAMAARREVARQQGAMLPSDEWKLLNPERRREAERRWREKNPELSRELVRRKQAQRRSTPWGKINNRIWPVLHAGIRSCSEGMGKYNVAIGYTWQTLRTHLEMQFTPEMSWDNWGSVWELDHIIPASSFKYESLDDPLFRECWALSNLRPLLCSDNSAKGSKSPEHQHQPRKPHG